MGINSDFLALSTLVFLIGGFVFLLLEHLDLKEWRKSVDARFHKLFKIIHQDHRETDNGRRQTDDNQD